jgi:hypothetical protein
MMYFIHIVLTNMFLLAFVAIFRFMLLLQEYKGANVVCSVAITP